MAPLMVCQGLCRPDLVCRHSAQCRALPHGSLRGRWFRASPHPQPLLPLQETEESAAAKKESAALRWKMRMQQMDPLFGALAALPWVAEVDPEKARHVQTTVLDSLEGDGERHACWLCWASHAVTVTARRRTASHPWLPCRLPGQRARCVRGPRLA